MKVIHWSKANESRVDFCIKSPSISEESKKLQRMAVNLTFEIGQLQTICVDVNQRSKENQASICDLLIETYEQLYRSAAPY